MSNRLGRRRSWRLRGTTPSRLFWLLRWHEGRVVGHETIIDVLWGGAADGGPLLARNIVAIAVHRLRVTMPEWVIETLPTRGYLIRPAA